MRQKMTIKTLANSLSIETSSRCEVYRHSQKCEFLLDEYILNNLPEAKKEDFELHLTECEFCLDEYEEKLQKMSNKLEVMIKHKKINAFLDTIFDEKSEIMYEEATMANAVGSKKPKTVKNKAK